MTHSFTRQSLEVGQRILKRRSHHSRKANGQFLTPAPLAKFLAAQLGQIRDGDTILDPAMGSGTLLCAVIDRLIAENRPVEVWLDGFELDHELFEAAKSILNDAVSYAVQFGIRINVRLFLSDFVVNGLRFIRPTLLDIPLGRDRYDHIISNPPYFKLNPKDERRQAAEGVLSGHTNIYTLFMGLAARMLQRGRACFIVPRSFCSGTYFTRFRGEFLEQALLQRVHLFEARDDAFSHDDVLQENVVITFASRARAEKDSPVLISSSTTVDELARGVMVRELPRQKLVSPRGLIRLPVSDLDEAILDVIDSWTDSLQKCGLEISTGPVVPFRAKRYMVDESTGASSVPLLWMQHVKPQRVTWPLNDGFHKPQYIQNTGYARSLLVRNANYVLLRRFSAKEEHRRLVAAPYFAEHFAHTYVGLENHLNYIYGRTREMAKAEVIGLSALLNSGLIDRYFRISNGNTQVNASELRALPLPSLQVIIALGELLGEQNDGADVDEVAAQILQTYKVLPDGFPVLRETRVS